MGDGSARYRRVFGTEGVDDRRQPTEVTVYDPLAADVNTRWLTVDAAAAVDLAEVA